MNLLYKARDLPGHWGEEANATPLETTTSFNSPLEKWGPARLKNYRVLAPEKPASLCHEAAGSPWRSTLADLSGEIVNFSPRRPLPASAGHSEKGAASAIPVPAALSRGGSAGPGPACGLHPASSCQTGAVARPGRPRAAHTGAEHLRGGTGEGLPSSFGAGLAGSAAPSRKERDAQQQRDPKPTGSRGTRRWGRAQIMETLFLI